MQVDIKSLNSPKSQPPKTRKAIAMNEPPKIQHEAQIEPQKKGYFYGHLPDELKDNVKNVVLRGISLPAKQKATILHSKLKKSDYIDKYLNRYLIVDQIAIMNDHLKFGLVYAFNMLETIMTDTTMIANTTNNKENQKMTEMTDKQKLNLLIPSE